MTIDTPNNIDVLMWCHCRATMHERINAPAVQDAIKMLIDAGAIKLVQLGGVGDVYATTDLGKAWVAAICNVPVPTVAFVDEMGRVLKV